MATNEINKQKTFAPFTLFYCYYNIHCNATTVKQKCSDTVLTVEKDKIKTEIKSLKLDLDMYLFWPSL